MGVDESVVILLVTAPENEAEAVARAVLDPKHAACVNIVPKIRAMYWWDGELNDEAESLLLIKTTKAKIDAVRSAVSSSISYEEFELLTLDVSGGNDSYINWVKSVVGA